jgi:hypothetical protein
MDPLIDAWRESTGQKYEFQIPASWIEAGLAPGLTATDPGQSEPEPPEPAGLGEPLETSTPEEV